MICKKQRERTNPNRPKVAVQVKAFPNKDLNPPRDCDKECHLDKGYAQNPFPSVYPRRPCASGKSEEEGERREI